MILYKMMPVALANHLWQSTVFGLAAALLAFALRNNRAGTRYWLWLAASLKFLIPFSILVAIGGTIHLPSTAPIVHSTFSTAVRQIGQPFAASPGFTQHTAIASPDAPRKLSAVASAIWAFGFAVVLLAWARNWVRIRGIARRATALDMDAPIRVLSCESSLEPGVFGILRPVLLLPRGITDHLEPAHLRAIVAHELCHVRRRDNMAAALHMLVEAIFWFHPLVWWIGGRLVDDRERACDEEVLRLGNQPRVYAESIVKTCQFFVESPSVCMSGVTGADLKKRLVHIMGATFAARMSVQKKMLLLAAGIAALALPIAAGLFTSASADDKTPLTFEAASIKPSAPGGRRGMFMLSPGGRVRTEGMTTKVLIEMAYDLKDAQLEGGPSWIDSERYNIEAKPDDSVAATLDKLPPDQRKQELGEMLRSLLRDRFKLVLGHDTKELPVYLLVAAKNGPKLKPSDSKLPGHTPPPELPPPATPMRHTGEQPRIGGEGLMMSPGHIQSTGAEMSMVVNALSMITHRVVINKTGLKGAYDFTLNWTPDETQFRAADPEGPGGPEGPGAPPPPDTNGPDLFTAIQEQLGLKLVAQKAPVDVLVIQHVEKPSED